MSNVLNLNVSNDIRYVIGDGGSIIGVSHDRWPFIIMRDKETGQETAIVSKDTGEPFGVIDSDTFNQILLGWLLVDDPELIDASK